VALPVVIAQNGQGVPVCPVTAGGYPMLQAANGIGLPIVIAPPGQGIPVTWVYGEGSLPPVTLDLAYLINASGEYLINAGGEYLTVLKEVPLPDYPVNITPPTISGPATAGATLTVTNDGGWSNSPTSYSYEWFVTTTGDVVDGVPVAPADTDNNFTVP
jgi:hypothetical protein